MIEDSCDSPSASTELAACCSPAPLEQTARNPPGDEMKALYHKLALLLHPDKPSGCTNAFHALESAYARKDVCDLVLLADQYNLLPADSLSWQEAVSEKVKRLQTECRQYRTTLAWVWATTSSKDALRPTLEHALRQHWKMSRRGTS